MNRYNDPYMNNPCMQRMYPGQESMAVFGEAIPVGDGMYIAATCPSGYRTHTVVQGDTLSKLAAAYTTTVADILAANPGLRIDSVLHIGQVLCIPPVRACNGTLYVLKSGDTLYNLAMANGITVQDILNANPQLDPQLYRAGDTICLPVGGTTPGACPAGYRTHTVVQGDTLSKLAAAYTTTVADILAANPGLAIDSILRIGQVLCIPPVRACNGTLYVLKSGDTLYNLAMANGITVQDILTANPWLDPQSYRAGDTICLPVGGTAPGTCPAGYRVHTVAQGDTLSGLAALYTTTVADILAANPGLTIDSVLRIGQMLCIPPVRACNGTLYVLKRGDTLYNLARAYGITVEDILNANPQINPRLYRAGDTICLPVGAGTTPAMPMPTAPAMPAAPSAPATCPADMQSYTVQAGDTWTGIAKKFDVSYYSIMHENPHVDMSQPPVAGTMLCLMPSMTPPNCGTGKMYIIKAGMTINDVAAKCNVTVEALLKANPNCPPSAFTEGRKICIPK